MIKNSNLYNIYQEVNSTVSVNITVVDLENKTALDIAGTNNFAKYILLVGLILLSLMTIGGNLAIILCVSRSKSLSSTNYSVYILSLACADICVGLVVQPLMIVYTHLGYWPLGNVPCTIFIIFDFCVCSISFLHLSAIAFDRLRSVSDPLKYRSNYTKARAGNICIILWIATIIFYGLPVVVTRILDAIRGTMVLDDCLYMPNKYLIIFVVIAFLFALIPFLIITSVKLILAMRAAERNINKTGSKDQVPIQQATTTGSSSDSSKTSAQNRRAIRTLSVLILICSICAGPWNVFWVILSFCSTCISDGVYEFSYWLAYSNSFANPYMYFIFNSDFRVAFRQVFCGQRL